MADDENCGGHRILSVCGKHLKICESLGLLDDNQTVGAAEGELLGIGDDIGSIGVLAVEDSLVEVAVSLVDDKMFEIVADAINIERFLAHEKIDWSELSIRQIFD